MIFIRHAQSTWNQIFSKTRVDPDIVDPPLTEIGQAQALAARPILNDHPVERIVTSPYRRALETAHLLRGDKAIEIKIDRRVGERRAFSCDIGTPASQLRADWPEISFLGLDEIWWQQDVEDIAAFEKRCGDFMDSAKGDLRMKTTLVVTHWGFIRAVTGHAVDNAEFVQQSFDVEET